MKLSFFLCAMHVALAQVPADGNAEKKSQEKRLPVEQMLSAEPIPPTWRTRASPEDGKPRKSAVPEPSPLSKPNTDRTFPVEQLMGVSPPERPVAIRSTLRQVDPVNKDMAGLALKGFDPVSYQIAGQPLKGREDILAKWHEATWRFISEEHRRLFLEQPDRYAPQYGGYCAYGMTRGAALPIDPENWVVSEEKLYLFHDRNLQNLWGENLAESMRQADVGWPRIRRKEPQASSGTIGQ